MGNTYALSYWWTTAQVMLEASVTIKHCADLKKDSVIARQEKA
jgi:hypothetical protein